MALIDGVAASDGHSHPLNALYIRSTSELLSNADVSWLDPPTLQLMDLVRCSPLEYSCSEDTFPCQLCSGPNGMSKGSEPILGARYRSDTVINYWFVHCPDYRVNNSCASDTTAPLG
jgi:hypothetical protein